MNEADRLRHLERCSDIEADRFARRLASYLRDDQLDRRLAVFDAARPGGFQTNGTFAWKNVPHSGTAVPDSGIGCRPRTLSERFDAWMDRFVSTKVGFATVALTLAALAWTAISWVMA